MTNGNKMGKKRPIWIWVILIFYVLTIGWMLLSFYLVLNGALPLSRAEADYFNNLTPMDSMLTIAVAFVNIIGAVALFLLRKFALYFFLTALAANIILSIWHGATKGWVEAIGGSGLFGAFFGYGLGIAVCVYVWNLSKRGKLY